MLKKLATFFTAFILFFSFTKFSYAQDLFNAPVIPVRELDTPLQNTLSIPQLFHSEATVSGTPVTWLLDYDAIMSATTSAFFKEIFDEKNEIGLILDVPPSLISLGKVDYPLHGSTSYLLNSYHPTQREVIIDHLISNFHAVFGFYPRTVASAYLDSYSLNYLQKEYGVTGAIMGIPGLGYNPEIKGRFAFPYFPSKNNALIPAANPEEKINLVVTFWQFGITNSTSLSNRSLVDAYLPEPVTSVTYQDFSTKFLINHPLTTPVYDLDSTYASPYLQVDFIDGRLNSLIFFNHHETESFRFDRNPNPFLKLTTYPLITPDTSLPLNSASLRFTPTTLTSTQDLNLPAHPQYSLIQKDGQYIYQLNSFWTPYKTPFIRTLIDLLKIIFLISVTYSLFTSTWIFSGLASFLKRYPLSSFLVFLGALAWSTTTIKSGSLTSYGLSFWGAHSHDATFHLSLIESFKNSLWPLNNPNLHHTYLQNYHFFYDYFLALVSRILNISSVDLYFRYLPPLMAFFIGVLTFHLLRRWQYSQSSINLSLFFIYFTGSLGFIPHLLRTGNLFGGESIFWMQQNITTLINPPFALSLIILLSFFILLEKWGNKLTKPRLLLLAFIASLLIQIKAYANVLLFTALVFTLISQRLNKRSNLSLIKLTLGIFIFTATLFLSTASAGNSLFIFKPFWFIESLVAAHDRLNWQTAANAWQAYLASGQFFKLFLLQLLLTTLFYVGNLGIRILALPTWWNNFNGSLTQKITSWITLFGLTIPFFFIQSGNSWNSIQFSYYSLFFLSLLMGPVVSRLLFTRHNLVGFLSIFLFIIFFTLPTTIGTLREFNSPRPSTIISHEELRVLDFLKNQPTGVVITPVFNRYRPHPYSSPLPIFASDSTGYIPALTGKPAYFADEVNLIIMGYDFKNEKVFNQKLYHTHNHEFVLGFLTQNNIQYLYQTPQHYLPENTLKYLQPLFDTGNYSIYTQL